MGTFYDFMRLLLSLAGFCPVRFSEPIPVEHPEGTQFNRTGGAGKIERF